MSNKWAIGITTVPERRGTTLPKTMASLESGGFTVPRLFVDGDADQHTWRTQFHGLPVTCHQPTVGIFANWVLGLWELLVRNPQADRFAMFQDDLVCVKHLCQYVNTVPINKTYLNLFTFLSNEQVIAGEPVGKWYESSQISGGNNQNLQTGRGALALVFSREGVEALLMSPWIVERPHRATGTAYDGRKVDGAIVAAMNAAGYREMVHNPSLVQHAGHISIKESRLKHEPTQTNYPQAMTFPGENFDAMVYVQKVKTPSCSAT